MNLSSQRKTFIVNNLIYYMIYYMIYKQLDLLQQLALRHQKLLIWVWFLAVCRGELSLANVKVPVKDMKVLERS